MVSTACRPFHGLKTFPLCDLGLAPQALCLRLLRRRRTCLLLLTALLFLFPANVSAIPISEYQQKLKNAIASLEALGQAEDESDSDYENRFNQTVDGIRTALPRNQTVESAGESCNVDNAWLHDALDGLKSDGFEGSGKSSKVFRQLRHAWPNARKLHALGK